MSAIKELKTAKTDAERARAFRAFFAKKRKWTTDRFADENGAHCAYGHLGCKSGLGIGSTLRSRLFNNLGRKHGIMFTEVNDGHDNRFTGETPKARILAALDAIISKEKAAQ